MNRRTVEEQKLRISPASMKDRSRESMYFRISSSSVPRARTLDGSPSLQPLSHLHLHLSSHLNKAPVVFIPISTASHRQQHASSISWFLCGSSPSHRCASSSCGDAATTSSSPSSFHRCAQWPIHSTSLCCAPTVWRFRSLRPDGFHRCVSPIQTPHIQAGEEDALSQIAPSRVFDIIERAKLTISQWCRSRLLDRSCHRWLLRRWFRTSCHRGRSPSYRHRELSV